MKRRDFLIHSTVATTALTAGCIDSITPSPEIRITNPSNNSEVEREFTVSTNVSNFEIVDPTLDVDVSSENTPSGYIAVSINEELEQGKTIESKDNDTLVRFLDGQTKENISVRKRNENNVYAYLVDENHTVLEYSDQVTVNASFEIIDTISIGADDALNVNPNRIVIPSGTEVTFNWGINGVNLHVESQPDESEWTGVESLKPEGFTYSYEFTVKGIYEFDCQPHNSAMNGTIEVI